MKRIGQCIFLVAVFLFCPIIGLALDVESKNAILYQLNENKIIYEKNAYDKVPIASLTKVMSAIVAIENIDNLDDTVVLTNNDFKGLIEANASVAGFKVGDKVTYRDLLYGLLLPSGAEAAYALANNTVGSIDTFVDMMNEKAKKMNLNDTNFANPTGLDSKDGYSTVYDVAQIFKYALSNQELKTIMTSKSYVTTTGLSFGSTLFQASDRYNIKDEYIQGGKTGSTTKGGLCLASFATNDGITYLLVTTGAFYDNSYFPLHVKDASDIYGYYIDNYDYQTIVSENDVVLTLPTKYLKQDKIDFYIDSVEYYLLNDYNKEDISYSYQGIEEIDNTINKNDKLGVLTIFYKDEKIKDVDIVLKEDTSVDYFLYIYDHLEIAYIGVFIVGLLAASIFVIRRIKLV